jgi:hypothetical protein
MLASCGATGRAVKLRPRDRSRCTAAIRNKIARNLQWCSCSVTGVNSRCSSTAASRECGVRTACAPALLGSLTRHPGRRRKETDDEEEWPAGSAMPCMLHLEQGYGTRDKTPSFQVSSSQKVRHFLRCCPVSVTVLALAVY